MHDHPRTLLQKAATSTSTSPPTIAPPAPPGQKALSVPPLPDLENPMYVNSHFSPSMIIILVVLLSAFLFMGFFAVYVRRCAGDDDFSRRGNSRAGRRDGLAAAQHGVDRSLVESFPMVSYAAVKKKGCNECVVCLTDFEGSENLRQLPKCKHVFHPSCIDMWLESHTTCPLCRRSLVNSDKWSVSFRWGGSSRGASLSARLGEDSSVRSRGGGSQTPREGGGEFSPSAPHANSIVSELATAGSEAARTPQGWRRLRRSNSTGHSLLKGALSRAAAGGGTPSSGCLPLSPFPLHRSRSVRLDGEAGQEEALIARVGPAAMPPSSDESRFGGGSRLGGGGGGGGGGGRWNPSHEPISSQSNLHTFSRLAL